MRPRQEIVEIFSTFLQFDADRVQGWLTDPKLRRSLERCLTQLPETERSDTFLVIYWHKAWQMQTSPLAQSHLAAYLQEVCYWAAQKTSRYFENAQFQMSDCFQVAIAALDKVLKGFDAKRSISLKGYASLKFGSVIKDILRQRQIADICTPWALLHKLSKKRLIESLQSAGISPEMIQRYVLAWTCFNAIHAPTEVPNRTATSRKLIKPSPETWTAIATLYNQQRQTQLPAPTPAISAETIEKWITACATAGRQYLYPTWTSINAPKPGQEEGELLDNLPQPDAAPALAEMIAAEERTQLDQINAVLLEAIAQLEPDLQQLLHLYYREEFTQQQVAQALQVQQYTISRQLTKIKRSLQRRLVEWSQETLHITPNLDVIESISGVLEEWLKVHYGRA
ncbi:MAG: sigma-70 family RNA polymerase sigma factor [Oscillatoriophycideae cyanobacterium NC_groundwater_1537_Pr4_S-0.65um_50_18]|nr:sigma-70 family RNA polymerase sigma factor [Oscillatoriophycideae cyanobacterium NC_groundwater_1537_Pr4_S-0.65um_50_18]